MKRQTIHIVQLLGADIRSRSRIRSLVTATNQNMIYLLDFTDVTFISRSFADELCSFMESVNKNIMLINVTSEIQTMLDIVKENRNKPRQSTPGHIKVLESMVDLEKFLNTI